MSEKKEKQTEEKTKKRFGHLSRREFLKDAGLVIGGSTMGSIAFAADTEAQQQVKGTAVEKDACPQESTDSSTIELTVNGDKYRFRVEPNWSLRQLLRDEIGLTSPKDWCGGYGAGEGDEERVHQIHHSEFHRFSHCELCRDDWEKRCAHMPQCGTQ